MRGRRLLPAQHKQPGAPVVPRAAPSSAAHITQRDITQSASVKALEWTVQLSQSHPLPCAGTTPTKPHPTFEHVQGSHSLPGRAVAGLTSKHSFPKSEFSCFYLYPSLLVLPLGSTPQISITVLPPKKAKGWGEWGELSLQGHRKASAVNKFNVNICTSLKVTVGNTGKSSCLVFLPDSREFNASSRLGFLSLDRGHHALEGSSSFEGHSG